MRFVDERASSCDAARLCRGAAVVVVVGAAGPGGGAATAGASALSCAEGRGRCATSASRAKDGAYCIMRCTAALCETNASCGECRGEVRGTLVSYEWYNQSLACTQASLLFFLRTSRWSDCESTTMASSASIILRTSWSFSHVVFLSSSYTVVTLAPHHTTVHSIVLEHAGLWPQRRAKEVSEAEGENKKILCVGRGGPLGTS